MKQKILHLCVLLATFTHLHAQDIEINAANFPDANFRNYLTNELSYYDNSGTYRLPGQDGFFTTEEVSNILTMECSLKGIASLKGIEFFTSLTRLECHQPTDGTEPEPKHTIGGLEV